MKKLFSLAALLTLPLFSAQATMSLTPWNPLFKGIDHAIGTNILPDTTFPRRQSVNVLRIDLTDPDVQLFTSPRAPNFGFETNETRSIIVSNYIKAYGVKVATDCNFYNVFPGGSDPTSEGLPSEVRGLLICTGQVVSIPDNGNRYASLMFTTNKEVFWNLNNRSPGTNSSGVYTNPPGIYTAATGFYPVLTNGYILDSTTLNTLWPDTTIHGVQPRTAFGVSQDHHYLFLMVIDGRQSGYSDGATDQETATWMLLSGASDAINMDGGGSTAMYKADCAGNPVPLGHSSYTAGRGRERIIGSHFGVFAPELYAFINNVTAIPGGTTAIVTWTTASNATSQVEYGLTAGYGTLSALDPTPVTTHIVTLTNLIPGNKYFYRVLSATDVSQYTSACAAPFSTTNPPSSIIFTLTNVWVYSIDNLDGISWQSPSYDDTQWDGGSGVLWCDTKYPNGIAGIQYLPLSTKLPTNTVTAKPYTTYYFRTHFNFNDSTDGLILTFTNYIDDGAAFYLNGTEINRVMLSNPAYNSTIANGPYCSSGDATCPHVFTVSGDLATNLVPGDNVLAVEVHNLGLTSPDITFGSSLTYFSLAPRPPFIINLGVSPGMTNATVTWTTLSNANSQVQYGLTSSYGNITPLDPILTNGHSVTLTGLVAQTTYYYQVISSCEGSNYTAIGTFITRPPPPPAFITNLVAVAGSTSVTISWMTVSNSTAQILLGLSSTSYVYSTVVDLNLVTNHSFTITGLQPASTYYYQVLCTNGGTGFTSNSMFVTLQLPIYNLTVNSGLTNATISWLTLSNATAQVQYGLTPALGASSPLDTNLTTSHSFTLIGLAEATNYYFRVLSSVGATQWVADRSFSTYYANLLPLTNSWKYSPSNYDAIVWQAFNFTETNWPGGPALLWADKRPDGPAAVQPRNTRMPISTGTTYPYTTYYFRTHFTNPANPAGYALVFSNFVDDGAVFYLNGTEIYRLRMPDKPTLITNATFTTGQPTSGDAVNADVFRLGGDWMTNLFVGENVMAVEAHNSNPTSPDVVFGSSVGFVQASASEIRLRVTSTDNVVTVSWDGKACTLQQAHDLDSPSAWSDAPGPVRSSPYSVTNPVVTTFYRLRN